MKKPQFIFVVLVVITIIGAFFYTQQRTINISPTCELRETPDPQWIVDYKSKITEDKLIYTEETDHFDKSNPLIKCVAQNIKLSAQNEKEAAQMALTYVYMNVKYDGKESNERCFESKASDILLRGTGQCDTQGNLLITLLRGIGIAARPVGGCLIISSKCESRSQLNAIIGIPEPIIEPIEDIGPEGIYGRGAYFGRGETDVRQEDFSRGRSGLHAWAEAFLPDEGWVTLEATSGQIIRNSCFTYAVELYPEDDYSDFCVSKNYDFVLWCKNQG